MSSHYNMTARKKATWLHPFLTLAVSVSLLLLATGVQAQDNTQPERIIVTGQGSASVAPDMAILALTVTREANTAQAALKAGSSAMAEVLAAMKKAGVAERDLQTSGFSIQ